MTTNSSQSLPLVQSGAVGPVDLIECHDMRVQQTGMPGLPYEAVAAVVTMKSAGGDVIASWNDDDVMVTLRDLDRKDSLDVDNVDFEIFRHGTEVTLQVQCGRAHAETTTSEPAFDAAITKAVSAVDAWARVQPEADALSAHHDAIWLPRP